MGEPAARRLRRAVLEATATEAALAASSPCRRRLLAHLSSAATAGVVYGELIQRVRVAPSPASALAGRGIRLLRALLPAHPPPASVVPSLLGLCHELRGARELDGAVLDALDFIEALLTRDGGAGSGGEPGSGGTSAGGDAGSVRVRGVAADQHRSRELHARPPRQALTPRYIAGAPVLGALRYSESDGVVAVSPDSDGEAQAECSGREWVRTRQVCPCRAETGASFDSSSSLDSVVRAALDGSRPAMQWDAAGVIASQIVDMHSDRALPENLALPLLIEMLESSHEATRALAFELQMRVVHFSAGQHCMHLAGTICACICETLARIFLLSEPEESVWQSAIHALLYIAPTLDDPSALVKGLDSRVLLKMIEQSRLPNLQRKPARLGATVADFGARELPDMHAFLVDLLVQTLYNADSVLDGQRLDSIGGIAVIIRLYGSCTCVVACQQLFVVLYDIALQHFDEGGRSGHPSKDARDSLLDVLCDSVNCQPLTITLPPSAAAIDERLRPALASRLDDKTSAMLTRFSSAWWAMVLRGFPKDEGWERLFFGPSSAPALTTRLKRLPALLESECLDEQLTGQHVLFRLLAALGESDEDQTGAAQLRTMLVQLGSHRHAHVRALYLRLVRALLWQTVLWRPRAAGQRDAAEIFDQINERLLLCVDSETDQHNLVRHHSFRRAVHLLMLRSLPAGRQRLQDVSWSYCGDPTAPTHPDMPPERCFTCFCAVWWPFRDRWHVSSHSGVACPR